MSSINTRISGFPRVPIWTVLVCIYAFGSNVNAQEKDSLKNMRLFTEIGQAYKKPSMHLSLSYSSSANIITSEEDTLNVQAEFYSTPGKAYSKFGEMEQVVTDSIAVLISEKLHRILLFTNAQAILSQMKAGMGVNVPKDALKEMCRRYQVEAKPTIMNTGILVLNTRDKVTGTEMPKESIQIRYDVNSKTLLDVTNTKRRLLPISENEYLTFKQDSTFNWHLFKSEQDFYAVREQTLLYRFLKIEYGNSIQVPVSVYDRVTKLASGSYAPVKSFDGYVVTEE